MTNIKKEFNPFGTSPGVWGPGVWLSLHSLGHQADSEEKIPAFIQSVNVIVSELPCDDCRKDGVSYIQTHPIEVCKDLKNTDGKCIGPFYWVHGYHNWVNRKIGKEELGYDEVYNYFEELKNKPCRAGDCTEPEPQNKTKEKSNKISNKHNNRNIRAQNILRSQFEIVDI